ncbi:MAG: hypothetical protein ABI318_12335 [Chthoniobacteraceae bacterium]
MPEPVSPHFIRRVIVAGFIGTVIEWYDCFLCGTSAALVFNRLPARRAVFRRACAADCVRAARLAGGKAVAHRAVSHRDGPRDDRQRAAGRRDEPPGFAVASPVQDRRAAARFGVFKSAGGCGAGTVISSHHSHALSKRSNLLRS